MLKAYFVCFVFGWKSETDHLRQCVTEGYVGADGNAALMRHIPCNFVRCSELRTACEGDTLPRSCNVTDHMVQYNARSASHSLCVFYVSTFRGYSVERQLTTNNKILIEIFMKLYMRSQKSQLAVYSMGTIWLHSSVRTSLNPSNRPHWALAMC